MSRIMHNNADISYSSINAGGGNSYQQTRSDNCCQNCFLNIPYATITSTLLVISGLIINFIASQHLLTIIDRFVQDLFYKHLYWLNEWKIIQLFIIGFISIIILINLFIGFITSFVNGKSSQLQSLNHRPREQNCSRNSATNCIMRFVFILNQLLLIIYFILFIGFTLFIFVLYLMKTICYYEQISNIDDKSLDNSLNQQQQINLQPFSNFLPLSQLQSSTTNETTTNLLIFKDNRLKTLCKDYISMLLIYSILSILGILLQLIGYYCYSIILTVNRIRIVTYKKYNELLYLSSNNYNNHNQQYEMNQYHPDNDLSFDNNGERF